MKKIRFFPVTTQDIYDITLMSTRAKNKKVYIFEKGDLSDFINKKDAEVLRAEFLKNKIKVKQITNNYDLSAFSDNIEFINKVMLFRYVPKSVFNIRQEILIFDDIVAIYDQKQALMIQNADFAKSQKQMFLSIWNEGISPKLGFKYKPNHSFYNSIDFSYKGIQIIIWPDADAKEAYKGDINDLRKHIIEIIDANANYYKDTSYLIGFIWSYKGDKMLDLWKFNNNHVDDRSGPLGDVRVYRNGKVCTDLGLASGNTLLVLGYEEKLRRQSSSLSDYLKGPVPKLPLEIMNGQDFF